MRAPVIALAIALLIPMLLLVGCKEEEVAQTPPPPPPDPGWPTASAQDAAVQFDLEEAHFHMRKARYADPGSYGSEYEMPFAVGYAQWAYEMQPDNDAAVRTVDHLVLENGSEFDVPYGYTPRCMWCHAPMPRSLLRWPTENGQKVVECPNCGAKDSFPTGLVLRCPYCSDVVAGTAAGGPRCPTCGRAWKALRHSCSRCGLTVPMDSRQGQRCPRCKTRWDFDVPFGNWPTRAKAPVVFTGSGTGLQCEAYTAFTGWRCPNKTTRKPDGKGKVYCWVHRNQAARDEVAAKGPQGGGAAAAPGPGGPSGGAPSGAPGGAPPGTTPGAPQPMAGEGAAPPDSSSGAAPSPSDAGGAGGGGGGDAGASGE
ncbi:hypothetical protein LLH03_00690 [bacterium]|nr:hypothetical protein [bacterium]